MKKSFCFAIAIGMMGCTPQSASSTQGGLTADPTARSFGIAAYVVDGDNVRMVDEYGMELGSFAIRDAVDSRIIDVALADGQADEIEVYRPTSDGRFFAPIDRNAATSVALGDSALAPLFATHDVKFTSTVTVPVPGEGALAPSTIATTSMCIGTAPNHNQASCTSNCDWTSDSPAGCVRPANLNVGCTNPSVLYPQGTWWWSAAGTSYADTTTCNAHVIADCIAKFGGTTADWSVNMGTSCYVDVPGKAWCGTSSQNTWTASCPRSTCGTPGQYDAVPRLRSCVNPGSCTKSQGTVGCTPYH